MIRYLAMIQAKQLNLFLVKGGVSKYYSPRMILNQTNLDDTKHCVVPFGAYVQANHEPTKTSSSFTITLDASSCVRHKTNKEVMNLWTSTVVN
jgi:hypothetical protein